MVFISEENYLKHREAHSADILRLGIIERSAPKIIEAEPKAIARMKAGGPDMLKAAELKASVILHKVFFSSFSARTYVPSEQIRREFGSERALCEDLYLAGMRIPRGFVAVLRTRRGLSVSASESALDIFRLGEPILAVDVSEHAYYGDFGFNKEAYLRSALSHLDLARADMPPAEQSRFASASIQNPSLFT